MLLSKIKKHLFLTYVRLRQKNTIKKIYKTNDRLLRLILESFQKLKSGNFSSEEIKIFGKCESYRSQLLENDDLISFEVFNSKKKIKVKDVCKKATSPPSWGRLLYFITDLMKNPNFLEIGTNLGISGSYILEAIKKKEKGKLITMEGVPMLSEISHKRFEEITSRKKFKLYNGLYIDTFPKLLKSKQNFNIIFIDGNHNKKSTLHYYEKLKSKLDFPAIIIIDDINWSNGMKSAWYSMRSDSNVKFSIDFYKMGILIIDNKYHETKQHFNLFLTY